MNTNLAKSSQWYDMSQRIGSLAGSDGQVVGPENVRNSSLAEEIEEFALNSSLSMMNDQTLRYVLVKLAPIRSVWELIEFYPQQMGYRKCYYNLQRNSLRV